MKFVFGDLVRNVATNEDGRVIEAYEENGGAIYMASVPVNGASWISGARLVFWRENELEFSRNESLGESLGA